VSSLITTTGYSTQDYDVWPMLAKTVLVLVMFSGAMAGSTAGGIKVSRIVIAMKGAYINVRKLVNPRYVPKAKFEGKSLEQKTINDVFGFITLYFFLLLAAMFILAFDPVNGQTVTIASDVGTNTVTHGFFSNFSSVLACISNIGPAFEAIGPYSSYMDYSAVSKITLALMMLIGRLEIFPVLILFNRRTWKRI
jgi:trk system potassium uptake protein TrkH